MRAHSYDGKARGSRLSRRRLIAGGAGLAVGSTALLAACGGKANKPATGTAGPVARGTGHGQAGR